MPQTESTHAGEFLLSEGNGRISRETITLVSGQNLSAGTVIGKITASGKYTEYADANVDGSEVAAMILYANVDATDVDKEAVAIARFAEVSAVSLTGSDASGLADLLALGIIAR